MSDTSDEFENLPIQFRLYRNLNGTATPAIFANFPNSKFQIVRLLDPEFEESWVSVGRIFFANGMTFLQGLEKFSLRPPKYSLDVSGLAPFECIWMPLQDALEIAKLLNLDAQLLGLFANRSAWSLVDAETSQILHNWRNPALPSGQYSTEQLCATPFHGMQALKGRQTLATQFTATLESSAVDSLLATLATWSSLAYEDLLEDGQTSDEPSNRANLWRIVHALLQIDSNTATPSNNIRHYKVSDTLVVTRKEAASDASIGRLFLPDAFCRLSHRILADNATDDTSAIQSVDKTNKTEQLARIEDRLAAIDRRLVHLSAKNSKIPTEKSQLVQEGRPKIRMDWTFAQLGLVAFLYLAITGVAVEAGILCFA